MPNEDVTVALVVIQRVELTNDGAAPVYEIRKNASDEGLLWAGDDIDETLRHLRGLLTGEEVPS